MLQPSVFTSLEPFNRNHWSQVASDIPATSSVSDRIDHIVHNVTSSGKAQIPWRFANFKLSTHDEPFAMLSISTICLYGYMILILWLILNGTSEQKIPCADVLVLKTWSLLKVTIKDDLKKKVTIQVELQHLSFWFWGSLTPPYHPVIFSLVKFDEDVFFTSPKF